jgi:8-oxo-dGTP pyrophosphatase MutT (NUDIX family)
MSTDAPNELLALLDSHYPWDAAEKRHLEAARSWLRGSDRPFDRSSYTPGHVTASVLVTSTARSRVLLIYHGKLDRWLQPGGHAEPGETDPVQIAVREVYEETGVILPPDQLRFFDIDIHSIPPHQDCPQHLHYDFRFSCEIEPNSIRRGSDAKRAEWFSRDEAIRLASDEGITRMVAKLHADERG